MQPSQVHETIAKHMLADGSPIVFDSERSHGSYVVDAVTGREYIDFYTFFASIPVGYNHPRLKEAEFLEKLTLSAIHKPANSDLYTPEMAYFVEAFSRLAMPKEMPHLFLVSGGALAIENALKTSFDWKVRKNLASIGSANLHGAIPAMVEGLGSKVIHFQEAFHGRSGYTMSLTNTDDPRKYMYFPKFDWPRVVNPKLRFPLDDDVLDEVARVEEIAFVQIKSALNQYKGDIAALIIETIQGEGGDNHFRPEFLRELRRLADEHEFLLIFDEVQSGMGVTGKMWAFEHYDLQPDIFAFGKKSQVCGIVASERIEEVNQHVFAESSRINSTWGGNLVDMVRCTRYLEIIEEENLLEHTAKVGEKMIGELNVVAEESKGMMSNVRGKGLMIAYDLPDQANRDVMMETLFKNGLNVLKSGNRSIRFRGMLDTPEEVVDKAVEIVAKSMPA
ncbi:MAG: L-lysine 6-transaminase [Anaerolineales bacterium]|nr:L-lysine 6-transaminase [Chloroflexota bacterium]MBL6982331.1 L-lysine 6-transaminase [Anaerolineales bacterium]